mmetsp:Transcript_66417/g.110430  ORF Transcript_66417/g.110430 Transcript_66417/m.110430 type:complete len:101 (+) Transcript_66417:906-1208(+)
MEADAVRQPGEHPDEQNRGENEHDHCYVEEQEDELEMLPGLGDGGCSADDKGCFLRRLLYVRADRDADDADTDADGNKNEEEYAEHKGGRLEDTMDILIA